MIPVLVLLALGILAIAIRRPSYLLIPYALTSIAGDGFGVAMHLLEAGQGWFLIYIRAVVMVASLMATFVLFQRRERTNLSRVAALLSVSAVVASTYIGIAWAAKSGEFFSAFNAAQWTGLYSVPLAFSSRNFREIFSICLITIFMQLGLALSLFLFPNAPIISAWLGERYLYSVDVYSAITDVGRLQGGRRLQAQFNNTNSYGLYAVLGLAFSYALIALSKRPFAKLLGISLFGVSIVAWTQTVSRGSSLGLIFGVLAFLAAVAAAPRDTRRSASALTVLVAAFIGATVVVIIYGDTLGTLLSLDFRNDPTYFYRTDALWLAFREIADNPIFGVPNEYRWPYNVPPHQLPVYYAATSGILVGLISTALVAYPLVLLARAGIQNASTRHYVAIMVFPTAILGVFLGTVLTNNIASPVMLWSTYVLSIYVIHTMCDNTSQAAAQAGSMKLAW